MGTNSFNRFNRVESILLILCIVSFALGLFLGGRIIENKNALVMQMMDETRKDLRNNLNSIVLVDKQLAEIVGYVPVKKDIVIGGEE